MPTTKRLVLFCAFCLAICCLISLNSPLALSGKSAHSSPADEEQTLRSLLGEVHELRLAIQRTSLNSYRAQIALERLRLQQAVVERLTRELEVARNEMSEMKLNQSRTSEMAKEMENQINREADPNRRADLEREVKMIKAELENHAQREQRHREREAQLTSQLPTEQAKLGELHERLDAMERELESQQSTEKPQAGGKRP